MLPRWAKKPRPITLRIDNKRTLTIPPMSAAVVALLLVTLVIGLWRSGTSPSQLTHSEWHYMTSPFRVLPSQFLPPPDTRPAYLPAPLAPKAPAMLVPNAVHYVYGLKPVADGAPGPELPYYAYLAMRSALLNLKPEKIYFHYKHRPTGVWWDLIAPALTLIQTEVPDQILGRPLEHFAHKADVLRLLAMKHSGGIYLDIDVFVFDELLYFPTTLGMEASPNSHRGFLDPTGLCNAVIIAAPQSPFIDRWLLSYESYEESNWAGHSVEKPWELARAHPSEIQVLNSRAFFWPMWHGEEVQYTHERDDWDFYGSGQYHAWESLAMRYLSELSPQTIRDEDTSFHRLVRP